MAQQHKKMFASHEKHHHRKPSAFQLIKQEDDKFFSKLLSKEAKATEPSFRVNDGLSSSVPFFWESRPGTPKHRFDDRANIPPLTPPPSYFLKSSQANKKPLTPAKKLLSSKSNFLRVLFLKGRGKKTSSMDTPPGSLPVERPDDDEDDEYLPVFPPLTPGAPTSLGMKLYGERRFTSQVSSLSSSTDSSVSDGDPGFDGSPTSTLYPGAMRLGSGRQRRRPVWPPQCK